MAEKVGIPFSGFFIIGLPGDNPKKKWNLYQFACKRSFNEVRFYHLLPDPDTELFSWVKKNGTFIVDPATLLSDSSGFDIEPAFYTPDFSREERIKAHHLGEALMVTLLLKKTLGKSLGSLLGYFCHITSIRKTLLRIGFRFTSLARKLQALQLTRDNR